MTKTVTITFSVTSIRWWEPTRSCKPIWGSMWSSFLWVMRWGMPCKNTPNGNRHS